MQLIVNFLFWLDNQPLIVLLLALSKLLIRTQVLFFILGVHILISLLSLLSTVFLHSFFSVFFFDFLALLNQILLILMALIQIFIRLSQALRVMPISGVFLSLKVVWRIFEVLVCLWTNLCLFKFCLSSLSVKILWGILISIYLCVGSLLANLGWLL